MFHGVLLHCNSYEPLAEPLIRCHFGGSGASNYSYPICSREKSKCAEQAFRSPVTQNMSPRLYLSLLVRLGFFLSNTAIELPIEECSGAVAVFMLPKFFLCRPGSTASEGDEAFGQLQRSLWC